MIDETRIFRDHEQYFNTCILFNYAIVGNYYTGKHVNEYFIGYLKEHQTSICNYGYMDMMNPVYMEGFNNIFQRLITISPKSSYTHTQLSRFAPIIVKHFHKIARENNRRPIAGLQLIQKLHNQCDQDIFKESRKFFKIEGWYDIQTEKQKVGNDNHLHNINERLKNKEMLLNVYSDTNTVTRGGHFFAGHSHTIFHDGTQLCLYDTNHPCRFQSLPEDWINERGYDPGLGGEEPLRGNVLIYTESK